MQPLFNNLNVIKHQFAANSSEVKRLEDMQKSEQLVIEALAFIRGRSLSETYCIIDEAQNLTHMRLIHHHLTCRRRAQNGKLPVIFSR